MIAKIDSNLIGINPNIQNWCKLPYPRHPKGCPNYGSEERNLRGIREDLQPRVVRECPPSDKFLNDIFDFSKDIFVIYNIYEVGKDAEERRLTHPKLKTLGDWYNVRYWQNRARRELYDECANFLDQYKGTIVDLCPETHGVNLVKVMKTIGIELKWGKWPPEHSLDNIVYQVAMGGSPAE
tara:strand:+ start:1139 stop:1681 length:543 start_codon:yes stop_codon:yes gene_type:complete